MTLEKLLNTLIQRGWKPFGRFDKLMLYGQSDSRKVFQFGVLGEYEYYLRDMVSIESGLWQYVCENGMIKSENGVWLNAIDCMYKELLINQFDYKYRVIESALKDESELEEFLLDNINVGDI